MNITWKFPRKLTKIERGEVNRIIIDIVDDIDENSLGGYDLTWGRDTKMETVKLVGKLEMSNEMAIGFMELFSEKCKASKLPQPIFNMDFEMRVVKSSSRAREK